MSGLSVGVAVIQGYHSGGPVVGVPLAIGYDKPGGTRATLSGVAKGLALQGCYAKSQGRALPNVAF